jgi:hypothetical protein
MLDEKKIEGFFALICDFLATLLNSILSDINGMRREEDKRRRFSGIERASESTWNSRRTSNRTPKAPLTYFTLPSHLKHPLLYRHTYNTRARHTTPIHKINMSTKKGSDSGKAPQTSQTPQIPQAPQPQPQPQPQIPQQQVQAQLAPPVMVPMAFTSQYLFPFPGQEGAPYFDGQNITKFINKWEDLTTGWPEDSKVKRIPLYCKEVAGNAIKALASYRAIGNGGNWQTFKTEVLLKFKGKDEEQKKYSEGYLRKLALAMREAEKSGTEYHAFIEDFCEKADKLLEKNILNEYRRISLFLLAFPIRIGNKLCKKCNIDLEDPTTITNQIFETLRQEASSMYEEEDTQMSKLLEQEGLSSYPQSTHKEKEKKKGKAVEGGGRKNEVDDLANMMKDLKIYQLEAQKKIEEQLAEIKKVSTGEKKGGLSPKAAPFVPPNQYGNRQWPQPPAIRGCYWDGGAHNREFCEDMQKAIERGDIHKRGSSVFLGREDSGINVRVPFPSEKDGEITWQKEWVQIELAKKESEGRVNSITLEQGKRAQKQAERYVRKAAPQTAKSGASHRAQQRAPQPEPEEESEEEGDDDDKNNEEIEYINGYPVVVTKVEVDQEAYVEEKRMRSEEDDGDNKKKRFAVNIPAPKKILTRGEPMELDTDKDMGKQNFDMRPRTAVKPGVEASPEASSSKDKGKGKAKPVPKTLSLWEKIRTEGDVTKISKKILDQTVPNLTLKEILAISPDLITEWFGVKKVPSVPLKEKDLKEAFEVCVTRWGKGAHKPLYACASPKTKGKIEGYPQEDMLIDCGSELCLLSKECFDKMDLPIDLEIGWIIGSATCHRARLYGLCHDVPVSVGGIEVNMPFFVMDGLSQEVILGRPWERMTRIKHDNRDDGSCFSTVSDKQGNSATFCSVPADHERNRDSAHMGKGNGLF